MEDKPTNKLTTRKTTPARWLGPVGALPGVHAFLLAIAMLATALAVLAPAASANAPNPTSVEVERYEPLGAGKYKVTVKGTWTWGAKSAENPDGVPNGAQNDCPDTRIGVGYAVSWGDNTANELESKPGPGPGGHPAEKIYVGDSEDNWVHSVTDGEETVAGPYKGHAGVEDPVKESMLGETPEALANAFGDKQGISSTDKGTRSVPTKEDAEDWYSNCGPQAQKTVTIGGESIKIGNSNDASGHATEKELEAGFPNGTWGPISHVYSKSGNYKICPVMYDPHGNHVGEHENNQGEITAGGPGHNGDNSVEGNGNENPACTVTALVPILTTTASPKVAKSGTAVSDSATIESSNSPEGKLTWELFGPYSSSAAIKASSCEAPFTSRFGPYEETVVAGTKVYTTPTEPKPTEPGVYQWVASFTSSNTTKNVSLPFVGCGEAAEQFEVSSEPGFSIEKEQKIAGEASYTKSKLRGKFLGETVEYQIKVSNTGNTELTFNPLTDLKCEKISPEAIVKLAAGKSETYTCEHKNLAVGTYTNQATISDTLESKNSNIVEVEVLPEPSFSIEKEQKFAGEASYRTTLLKGTVGEVVDYKILIKNTGNAPLTMSNFTDTGCTNIIAGSTSIPVNGSSTYTCEYKLTAADIAPAVHKNNATVTGTYEGTPVEHTSNTVEAQALSEESFTIEKTQQLEGAGGFGTAKLIGKVVGEIVEYKIKVTNNGNVPLTFSNFTDTGCEGISGGPVGALAPTASATYTCQHKLTSADIEPASHKNNATVTGTYQTTELTHTSNTVEATVKAVPSFTIEKTQQLEGAGGFGTAKLIGKVVGEIVEYKITVTNNGNVPLTFSNFTDTGCEGISGGPVGALAPTASATYTCQHKLTSADIEPAVHKNNATVTGTYEGSSVEHTSNTVEATVKAVPSFTIEKTQQLEGAGGFGTAKLIGKVVGEIVEYKIKVTNNGNVPLTFSNFTDTGCEGISGGPVGALAPTASATYTCQHKLTSADIEPAVHKNNATVTGTYEGSSVEHTSNTVEATVKAVPSFTIEKTQQLEGAGGFGTAKLIGKVVGEIVEYKIKVTNNGNVPLTFSNFTDTGCEGISGGPVGALAPTASATYTCQHKLTSADIEPAVHKNNATVTGTYEGSSVEHTSNTVEATVKAVPSFTIEKTQQLEGAGGFRTTKLVGKVGEIVEYEITVTNNGNVPLTFSNFTDTGCETIAGGPAGALAPTKSATYTCVHKLTSADVEPASHKNNATVTGTYEGTPVEHTSNTVEAAVKAEPNFMIEKEQRLEGQPTFTKAKLIGKVGETVFYKITVKNTGNSELNLGALSDPNCEGISPSGAVKLSVGGTQVYFCEHKNLQVGFYYNVATIQNNNEPPKESPRVEVEVPAEPGFMIEKEQKLGGSFTKSKLIGKLGETVSYKIIVTNTGNVPLTFGALKDPNCESISPSGGVTIAAGFSQTYTCEHKDLGLGTYSNIATIETTTDLTQESNKVEVEVPAEPSFTIEKEQRIAGETAYTKTLLKAKVGQTVEYKITVKNIGNVELSLGALNDTHCENIQPAGAVKLAVGATETYTCEHKNLQVGIYYNVAAIQNNNEPPKESPKVEVEVPAEPNFTIEKEQRLAGETAYTKLLLKAKVGQTVEYKITVKNIGNVELSLSALTDTHCENIQPSGAVKLAVGATETYTCEHKNLQVGTYYNVATIQNNNEPPKESPKVEVEVPEPSFTIEKEQRIAGEANYTKELLKAKVGQTVEYKITVKNTGATELSLSALTDTHCENIQPSGAVKLAVGATETYTCEHKNLALGTYYNVATIQNNNEPPKESPKVEVEVPAEPDFTVEKEQRIAGEANYTKTLLKAKVGQTVEYKITVKNIGNVELSLGALNDTHCENIQPSGAVKLAVGATETYTCEHKNLALGTYYNVATIQNNNEPPKESPKVEVEVPAEPLVAVPSFTIEKEQKLAGEANYTKALLKAKVGQTVEYKITVHNTGNTELTLGALTDTKCENIQPSGSVKLAVGATETYTCEHKNLGLGTYYNVATIANGSETPKESPKVEVEVPAEPSFTIEKEQKLASEANYTKSKLPAKAGETVDYKITVHNTGNTELNLGPLTDTKCENIQPSGSVKLAVGASQVYSCEHKDLAEGVDYTNVATIANGSEPAKPSNAVEAEAPKAEKPVSNVLPKCEVSESAIQLFGVEGEHSKPFKVSMSSLGIKKAVFSIDGKKFKTFKSSQAKHHKFTFTIDPKKYRYGVHKVSVKTKMTEKICKPIARSADFVRPKPEKPKFTG